jgi:hypothetical protein
VANGTAVVGVVPPTDRPTPDNKRLVGDSCRPRVVVVVVVVACGVILYICQEYII